MYASIENENCVLSRPNCFGLAGKVAHCYRFNYILYLNSNFKFISTQHLFIYILYIWLSLYII